MTSTVVSRCGVRAELRVAFAMVDKDGDGRITPRELMTVMAGLGFKSDDVLVKQMIARFDADGICLTVMFSADRRCAVYCHFWLYYLK